MYSRRASILTLKSISTLSQVRPSHLHPLLHNISTVPTLRALGTAAAPSTDYPFEGEIQSSTPQSSKELHKRENGNGFGRESSHQGNEPNRGNCQIPTRVSQPWNQFYDERVSQAFHQTGYLQYPGGGHQENRQQRGSGEGGIEGLPHSGGWGTHHPQRGNGEGYNDLHQTSEERRICGKFNQTTNVQYLGGRGDTRNPSTYGDNPQQGGNREGYNGRHLRRSMKDGRVSEEFNQGANMRHSGGMRENHRFQSPGSYIENPQQRGTTEGYIELHLRHSTKDSSVSGEIWLCTLRLVADGERTGRWMLVCPCL